jgi:RecA/RadA recombinase
MALIFSSLLGTVISPLAALSETGRGDVKDRFSQRADSRNCSLISPKGLNRIMGDLQELSGVGNTAESQLNDMGIETINELANTDLEKLKQNDIRMAEKIHQRAKDRGANIETALSIEEEQESANRIPTSVEAVDEMLGGGLQEGFLVGISGESKAGKTQFALQCLASASENSEGAAVYIETEPNRFQTSRVKSLCQDKDAIRNIYKIDGYTPDEDVDNLDVQYNAYKAVSDSFDDVSIVVVDSFIANFRLSGKFESRADLPERNSVTADHLQKLQSLCNEFDCPILMTLQVQGNPEPYSSNVSLWGPALMDHTITHIIHMSHAKGELKEANLKGHPGLPDESVTIKIPENAPLESVE